MTRSCLLFDLDGTLCATDDLHYAAFVAVSAPHGRSITRADYNRHIMGFGEADIKAYLFPDMADADYASLVEAKEMHFRALLDELPPLPGALDLLDRADAAGLPYVVVTNAPRASGSVQLSKLGLSERMGEPVYGQELARPKPDPLPYLAGLERLSGSASKSVAFEDSRSGIRSAKGAGLAVIGMATTLDEAQLIEAGASIAVPDYRDRRLWDFLSRTIGL
jgi:HAD superfamily hydrolase (TIGR01509 family)